LPLFVLAHFAHHLLTALPIPLLPLIRDDFALDYTQSGLLLSAFTLCYGIGQLPAGWLADHVGRRTILTISITGVGVAGLIVGLAPTYITVVVFLALMGIAGGGYHPASPPLILGSVSPHQRGQAMGFHAIGGSASYFLAPLIAAAIATAFGWRVSFISLAVFSLLFGIVFHLVLGKRLNSRKAESTITGSLGEAQSGIGRADRLIALIIMSSANYAILISVVSFIPLYLVDHFGVGKGLAAALVASIYSSGLWASPLGGYLSDRFGRVPVIIAVCLMGGPVIYLLNLIPYGFGMVILLVSIGMVIYLRMPVAEAYVATNAPERHRSTILGIYYFSAMEGSGVLTPLMGYSIDHFGFSLSFTISAVTILAVTLVCSLFLWGSQD